MKQFTLTISVDENLLLQTREESRNLEEDTDIKSIIEQEFGWLSQSGISISGDLIDRERTIFIDWSIDDIRERATERNLTLTDEDCLEILESLENNHDANIGITWNTIDFALDNFQDS